MRIYQDFSEAFSEVKRDIVEMGMRVYPKTYQDKDISEDSRYETLELQNYIYTVTHPVAERVPGFHLSYCDTEFGERVKGMIGEPINPGIAWRTRPEIWYEFLESNGKFSYTYPERLSKHYQVHLVMNRLREDPDSRQLYISIWDIADVKKLGGISRVPCSLGYLLQVRKDALNITYLQRSCDFVTHMSNDVHLACRMQEYLAASAQYQVGNFTHWIGSLHLFKKDAEGVF